MKVVEIKGKVRTEVGKKASSKLRAQGDVPCVLYGGKENIHFYTEEKSFYNIVYSPSVFLIKLDIGGKNYEAAMKEIQFHPVSDKIQHVDFVQVFDNKEVTINIPVNVVGNSIGVKNGGKMRVRRRTLKVKGFAKDLPDVLDIDITKLNIGGTIKVEDLSYKNLTLLDPQKALVISVVSSRVVAKGMVEELPEEVGEEETEGEEPTGEAPEENAE